MGDMKSGESCCGNENDSSAHNSENYEVLLPMAPSAGDECGGSSLGESSGIYDLPGYKLWHFVEDFIDTAAGIVPRVKTSIDREDQYGTLKARSGFNRMRYSITPGLYCVGSPDKDSPEMVSANYKLSFDALRKELNGINTWVLVIDTRGINVWCAAGEGTFSTDEVINRVKLTGLEKVVNNRELILPQLSATGVNAKKVKKGCGFKVVWGPIRAMDIKRFLDAGKKAESEMRLVTFSFFERVVLIPIEFSMAIKPLMWILLTVFILSGIGSDIFSISDSWTRGLLMASAVISAVFAGAVAAPALLPWIPGKAFSVKGAITGLIPGICLVLFNFKSIMFLEMAAIVLVITILSSYLAMNFTGATPFTSPTGVEAEMKKAIPLQAAGIIIAVIAWVGANFLTI